MDGIIVGDEVKCMYGVGRVVDTRNADGMYVVSLHSWKLATNKSPIIYMQRSAFQKLVATPSVLEPLIEVGDIVCTAFGTGKVKELREDGMHRIEPIRSVT